MYKFLLSKLSINGENGCQYGKVTHMYTNIIESLGPPITYKKCGKNSCMLDA